MRTHTWTACRTTVSTHSSSSLCARACVHEGCLCQAALHETSLDRTRARPTSKTPQDRADKPHSQHHTHRPTDPVQALRRLGARGLSSPPLTKQPNAHPKYSPADRSLPPCRRPQLPPCMPLFQQTATACTRRCIMQGGALRLGCRQEAQLATVQDTCTGVTGEHRFCSTFLQPGALPNLSTQPTDKLQTALQAAANNVSHTPAGPRGVVDPVLQQKNLACCKGVLAVAACSGGAPTGNRNHAVHTATITVTSFS